MFNVVYCWISKVKNYIILKFSFLLLFVKMSLTLVEYDSSSDEGEEMKIMKKQKESVKIRIPSLKEFEEDEEKPLIKKPKLQETKRSCMEQGQSGSGLFSLLPPPKNTSTLSKPGFVPHILSSKKEQPVSTPNQSKNISANAKITSAPSAVSEEQESDDENPCTKEKSEEGSNFTASNDFFWLDDLISNSKAKEEDYNSFLAPAKKNTFIQNLSSHLPSSSNSDIRQTYLNKSERDSHVQPYQQLSETDACEIEENSDYALSLNQKMHSLGNYSGSGFVDDPKESLLKDKEFLKLQGRRREFDDINIIDVNADDQLTNKNEWLMKNITEEMTHRPKKKHNMPTQQQKRKHQITYLAFQAKEREMDLKNQWALNSRTRRETQAKYGF